MRWWPWRKWPEPEQCPCEIDRAREARERAEGLLADVRALGKDATRVAEELRKIRKRNHLVEILEASIRAREEGSGDHA